MTFRETGGQITTMETAFATAGVVREETPQKAAERIWKETKHDPLETMRRFDEWARQSPERMLAVLGPYWNRAVRAFLERRGDQTKDGTKIGGAFWQALRRHETGTWNKQRWRDETKRRSQLNQDEAVRVSKTTAERGRLAMKRKLAGIKVVRAEVDVTTGAVVNLIDKEYGPFAHIRIFGSRLQDVNTEQALLHCDGSERDVRFIRALCQMIPDPRKTIGEQWTADMIRAARKIAESGPDEKLVREGR